MHRVIFPSLWYFEFVSKTILPNKVGVITLFDSFFQYHLPCFAIPFIYSFQEDVIRIKSILIDALLPIVFQNSVK